MNAPCYFVVYWSKGPADNPEEGRMTVEASGIWEAARRAELAGLPPNCIDGVLRQELHDDVTSGKSGEVAKCPDCFGGLAPVFHGDTTSDRPCPTCQGVEAPDGARLERAVFAVQKWFGGSHEAHSNAEVARIITEYAAPLAGKVQAIVFATLAEAERLEEQATETFHGAEAEPSAAQRTLATLRALLEHRLGVKS